MRTSLDHYFARAEKKQDFVVFDGALLFFWHEDYIDSAKCSLSFSLSFWYKKHLHTIKKINYEAGGYSTFERASRTFLPLNMQADE